MTKYTQIHKASNLAYPVCVLEGYKMLRISDTKDWYTSTQIADYFDVSKPTVLRWLKDIPDEYKINITGSNSYPGRFRYHKKVLEIIVKKLRDNN